MGDLLGTGQVARVLDCSSERVRSLVKEGKLEPVGRTSAGRVFRLVDVEALQAERAARTTRQGARL